MDAVIGQEAISFTISNSGGGWLGDYYLISAELEHRRNPFTFMLYAFASASDLLTTADYQHALDNLASFDSRWLFYGGGARSSGRIDSLQWQAPENGLGVGALDSGSVAGAGAAVPTPGLTVAFLLAFIALWWRGRAVTPLRTRL